MKVIKQKLNSLVWLNIKRAHAVPSTTTAPPPHSIPTASSSTAQPSSSTSQPTRRPQKRALLIGIAADPPPELPEGLSRRQEAAVESPLPVSPGRDTFNLNRAGTGTKRKSSTTAKPVTKSGSIALITKKLPPAHNDVALMKKALTTWYGYKPKDITILIDDGKAGRKQPTRENILAEIKNLVSGIEAGDTVFFHFAGHGTQEDTEDIEEEDKKNEVMLTCDGQRIIDNELHKYLVKPLPKGSRLIAVCDACHSGSLLDLPHSKCNAVYVPWVNKGQRRSRAEQNNAKRRQARISTNHASNLRRDQWAATSIDGIMKSQGNVSTTTLEMINEDRVLSESPKHMNARGSVMMSKDTLVLSQSHVHAHVPPHGEEVLPHGRSSLSKEYDALSSNRVTPLASTSLPYGSHSASHESLPHGKSSLFKEYESHSPKTRPLVNPSTSTSMPASHSPSQPQSHPHFAPLPHHASSSGSGSGSLHHVPVPHHHPQRTPPIRHKHISHKVLSLTTHALPAVPSRALHGDVGVSFTGEGEGDGHIVETPHTLYCTGFCASNFDSVGQKMSVMGEREGADVICLSSSTDSQKTWNDAKGRSMTYQLYKILEKNQHPTLPFLLKTLSHSLHKSYMKLHLVSRQYKDRCHQKQQRQRLLMLQVKRRSINGNSGNAAKGREGEEEERVVVVEMNNFQEPVLSSFVPLPEDKVWNP